MSVLVAQVAGSFADEIALGHPLGTTGAIRAASVIHALRRNNLR